MELILKSLCAGILFGVWPLVMQRSGLQGHVSAAFFAFVAFATVAPFAAMHLASAPRGGLIIATAAGIIGGMGLLAFNSMLSKVSVASVGTMIAIMILVQLLVPIIYKVMMTGTVSYRYVVGTLCAVVAIYLLATE